MRLRTTLLGLAGTALALGTLTSSAQADRDGWEFTGQIFFWQNACEAAGKAGLGTDWSDYDCRGTTWRNYELWALTR